MGRKVISVALVRIKEGESFESAFRRFKKSCEKAGILSEVKKREHFEKPSVRLKKKSIAARVHGLAPADIEDACEFAWIQSSRGEERWKGLAVPDGAARGLEAAR